jgi:arylsulfatase A-like enzyme
MALSSTRRLRCSQSRLALVGALLPLCLPGCAAKEPTRPSGVLITLDTTNVRALDAYGTDRGITPRLLELAAASVVYERAYTTAPITLPAHSSMMTGLYPLRHGVRDNGLMQLPSEATTLAELASEAGYETAAFVAARVLSAPFGLDQGFDTFDEPSPGAGPKVVNFIQERRAPEVTDKAIAWLRARQDDRPFFLWVHYFDPHAPYEPPPDYLKQAAGNSYLGEVAAMDAEVGRLLDALREEVGLEHLMIGVAADHGEALFRHGEPTHCAFIYDDTVQIPLMLRFPGGRRAGERSREIVSVVDLLPTFIEELGLAGALGIDGLSLSQGRVPAERGVYVESYTGYLNFGWSPLAGWVDSHGKYLHSSKPEFYDLGVDPKESEDLFAARPQEVARYRQAIEELSRRPRLATGSHVDLSEEQLRELRALGYAAVGDMESELIDPLEPCDRPAPWERAEPYRNFTQALSLAYTGDRDEALRLLRGVIAENPGNLYAQEALGGMLIEAQQFEEALGLFEGLIARGVDRFAFRTSAGWLQERAGNFVKAEEHYARALELRPGEEATAVKLANVRQRMGRE